MRKQANNNSVYLESYTFKKYPQYIDVNLLDGRQSNKRFGVLKWLWLEFENVNEDHVPKLIGKVFTAPNSDKIWMSELKGKKLHICWYEVSDGVYWPWRKWD